MLDSVNLRSLRAAAAVVVAIACVDTSGPFAKQSVTNVPDTFDFTGQTFERTANTTLTYDWVTTSAVAAVRVGTVDTTQAPGVFTGMATIRIRDAAGTQVYTRDLAIQGTDTTVAGAVGTWKIDLVLSNMRGDLQLGVVKAPRELTVVPNTTGTNKDPDGYRITLDATTIQDVPLDGIYTFKNLSPASHTVVLTGVAGNCTVTDGMSRTLTVPAAEPATATFNVVCT